MIILIYGFYNITISLTFLTRSVLFLKCFLHKTIVFCNEENKTKFQRSENKVNPKESALTSLFYGVTANRQRLLTLSQSSKGYCCYLCVMHKEVGQYLNKIKIERDNRFLPDSIIQCGLLE